MATPSASDLYRSILEYALGNGETFSNKQLVGFLKDKLSIDDSVLNARTESGRNRFMNRLGFATNDLKKAGLLDSPQGGRFRITQSGSEFIKTHQGSIGRGLLNGLARDRKQRQDIEDNNVEATVPTVHLDPVDGQDGIQHPEPPTPSLDPNGDEGVDESDATPDEVIADAYQQLQDKLADDMLDALKGVDPYQFERIVLALLEKMGYGEVERDKWGGRGGDGGIDGVINQDPLGLEQVYVQAKHWQGNVGTGPIFSFSGSLDSKGASKGVFITTSRFSSTARQTANSGSKFIRLIDGQELARLMVEHGVGVVTENTYEVKKLDENYFSDSDDI